MKLLLFMKDCLQVLVHKSRTTAVLLKVGIGQFRNGVRYLSYKISSKINTAKVQKTHIDETLSEFYVKFIPRVPVIFLSVEKIECEHFDFVFFPLFYVLLLVLLPYFLPHNSKTMRCICERSAHQMTMRDFPFLVRATCEVR